MMEQPRGPGRVQTTGSSRLAVSTGGVQREMGEEKRRALVRMLPKWQAQGGVPRAQGRCPLTPFT